jgi:hypothetical protein
MSNYFEEKLTNNSHSVVVCVPYEKYSEFLKSFHAKNNEILNSGFNNIWQLESLRPNLKRQSKCSLNYVEFQGAYF